MSPLQALYERARQEWAASANDTIPNPLAPLGPRLGMDIPAEAHYNPARDVPVVGGLINRTVNGPLHALGLVNEGAGNVAQGIGGGAMLLAALAQVRAADAGLVDPNNTATQAARLALAQGFGHPGRALAAAREGPDTPTALLAGGLEMAANPLNYAGPAAAARAARLADPAAAQVPRAVAGVQNVAAALDAMNRLGGLPLGITKGGRARLLPEIFGAAKAPAADAGGAVARLLADAPVETSGGVPLAGLDLPLAPGRRNYNAAARLAGLPPVEFVPPEPSPLAPESFNIRRAAKALAPPPAPSPPKAIQPVGALLGAARTTAQPNPLEQLVGAGQRVAARDVPLPTRPETGQLPLPEAGPSTAVTSPAPVPLDFADRAGTIRAVANAPVEHLNNVLRDLHNAVYPGQQADFAIPALTGQPRAGFRTSTLTDHPGGNAAEPYLDYMISRVQKDKKAAARLADINPQLADDVSMVAENPLPLAEHKRLVQALFGVGPQGADVPTPAAAVPSPSAPPAAPAGTLDDVRGLILDHAQQFNTRYPPLDPAFYAKRANVDPAQVPAMLDQLVQEGTLGRLPDGSLAVKPAAGAAADAAGGGGFGLLPARLGTTLAGAGLGTGLGGLAGGELGLATGHRDEQLKQDVAAGAGLGALAGGSVGSVAPEIAQAAPQVARQLAAASRGTMLSPAMYARGVRAGLAKQAEAAQATGPRGLGGFIKALPAQWRASVVMTFKQLPQDAITRWVTLWGIAKKELGVADPDIARWQETIASQRDAGAPLDTPVERALRALGQDRLATPAGIHEVYGTDFLSAEAARRRSPLNRGQGAAAGAIFSAFNGLRQVNPLAVAAGAVKGRYQPFINGFVGFMNGVQHDAFRYAMAEKTLQRDIPPLSQALIADLGARGVDVAPLVAKGDYFSGADVARVAGQAVGDRWSTLVEETIRNGGDRVAFLAGDFRDKSMLPGERGLAAVFPFVRWPLHYGPVFAEVAANHPRLAAVAAQTLANQRAQAQQAGSKAYEAATTPITTETPVLGALARARLGGQKGVLRAGLLGAVVPYANLAGGIDMPPDDANPYEKATALGDAIGFSPNPLIQAGAYVTGLDYRAPGALSRTAGLEGAAGLLPGPLGRLSMPAPGAALDALREQLTGQSSEYDPVMRRYAELVLARTGQELAVDANAPYLAFATPEARALYDQAKREVLTAGAVGNLASVASPVSLAARSAEGETIRQAKATVPYSADLIARMSPDLAATMQAVNARYLASVPATRAYRGASPSAREALLLGDIAAPGTLAGALDPLARRQIKQAALVEIRRTQPR